ncbi:MAG: hypothetical protein NC302_03010 [Bacteroidales bacterium]|nr:hypothetical protein [Bacteroidales bacterium]MCM1414942.1 hypothetical protein [bacterium]MCM1423090.1 hypothetical protein [bacterium]
MYQREIIYMGLHKDGSRVGSAGFLKAEKGDKTSKLTMTVKNIPHSIEGRFPVRYRLDTDVTEEADRADWREEDGITLQNGGGVWEKEEPQAAERIRVQIFLPNGYLVEGGSKEPVKPTPPKPEQTQETEPAQVRRDISVAETAAPVVTPRETAPMQQEISAAPAVTPRETAPIRRDIPPAEPSVAIAPERPPLMADALAIEGLKEDKWEQLLDTYDRIHPYGDIRVYVKLAPKDFIILSSGYQHLVNNSFLLHGFYNYRYVILGKEGEDYCLGVPGVFYEREKMVALMFGFEAFECEGGDPKPGDFGYYLRKVEL